MKMAENPIMLTFQNNCESINSNCVEAMNEDDEKIAINNDITSGETTDINKPGDEPTCADAASLEEEENLEGSMQDDAVVDEFLAGDITKNEFEDDDTTLLLANIESENDGIEFKSDNVIVDCRDFEKADFSDAEAEIVPEEIPVDEENEEEEEEREEPEEEKIGSPVNSLDEEMMETENAESLTKMQIMEDVREGCSVQPSSPGHADERLEGEEHDKMIPSDTEENGFEEETIDCAQNGDASGADQRAILQTETSQKTEETTGTASATPEDGKNSAEDRTPQQADEEAETAEKIRMEESETGNHEISNHANEESSSNATTSSEEGQPNSTNKRKADDETLESQSKRLHIEIQENFQSRDKILNEFIEMSECNSLEQYQMQTSQILAEIRTLNELAKEKEREWNHIIHLKKIKEELLLRMQRRKQVMMMSSDIKAENGDSLGESHHHQSSNNTSSTQSSNQSILKNNLGGLNNSSKLRIPSVATTLDRAGMSNFNAIKQKLLMQQKQLAAGTSSALTDLNGSLTLDALRQQQNKQRQVVDVQSIIADYRQRHPEMVPRRGRRIRGAHHSSNDSVNNNSSSSCRPSLVKGNHHKNVMSFSSLALGSGAQVHHNNNSNNSASVGLASGTSAAGFDPTGELGLLLNAVESSRTSNTVGESSQSTNEPSSFKDMLVQFARLSQTERNELIQNAIKPPPPPYPEVTVHAVPPTTISNVAVTPPVSNSLLHGILTKTPAKTSSKSSFSPTLARLLTAPERGNGHLTSTPATSLGGIPLPAANMSISEILSTSKARNEITITPVVGGSSYEAPAKGTSSNRNEEVEAEAEDSVDRLVIDENTEHTENNNRTKNTNGGGGGGGGDASSDGDEVPQCQGCNQKSALFVCAGCGNQWYCSRDCQVAAWDDHSEICSG